MSRPSGCGGDQFARLDMDTLEEITRKSTKYSVNDKENECIHAVLGYLGFVLKINSDAEIYDNDKKHILYGVALMYEEAIKRFNRTFWGYYPDFIESLRTVLICVSETLTHRSLFSDQMTSTQVAINEFIEGTEGVWYYHYRTNSRVDELTTKLATALEKVQEDPT